jgi:Rrf2 family cysteine metabolism transcriptional repressor
MALRMSTRSRYGVRLMVSLSMSYGNGITLLRDVSRSEGISEKYLGQIIIPLKSAGMVVSQRGSHGGYSLARPPEEITVKDVVEAIEGRIAVVSCVEDGSCDEEGDPRPAPLPRPSRRQSEGCPRAVSCVARSVWRKLSEDIERSLSSFTLAELARQAQEISRPAPNYAI